MKLKTSRFGEITVKSEDVLNFQEGILGFEKYRSFTIVDPEDNTFILWLQSLEAEQIAFPMIEPQIFMQDYCPMLMPTDIQALDLKSVLDAKVYSILTIPQDITQMSANLKAPIIVNSKRKIARQIVLQDNKLNVRQEIYTELKRAINNFTASTSDDQKRTNIAPINSQVAAVQAFTSANANSSSLSNLNALGAGAANSANTHSSQNTHNNAQGNNLKSLGAESVLPISKE